MEREEDHLVFGEFGKWVHISIFDFKAGTGDDRANGGGKIDPEVKTAGLGLEKFFLEKFSLFAVSYSILGSGYIHLLGIRVFCSNSIPVDNCHAVVLTIGNNREY